MSGYDGAGEVRARGVLPRLARLLGPNRRIEDQDEGRDAPRVVDGQLGFGTAQGEAVERGGGLLALDRLGSSERSDEGSDTLIGKDGGLVRRIDGEGKGPERVGLGVGGAALEERNQALS